MKAILLLVAVVGALGFRWATVAEALPTDGRAMLEHWIQLEFQRAVLDDGTLSLAEAGEALDETRAVRIENLSANGQPDNLIVKVELAPNAAIPRGTNLTRFYRLEHSMLTGWQTPGRATAIDYYLRLF